MHYMLGKAILIPIVILAVSVMLWDRGASTYAWIPTMIDNPLRPCPYWYQRDNKQEVDVRMHKDLSSLVEVNHGPYIPSVTHIADMTHYGTPQFGDALCGASIKGVGAQWRPRSTYESKHPLVDQWCSDCEARLA